jgi:dTDP-glucose 4,6-dehydratase
MSYFHTFGVDVVMTRCSNNYGPFQFPEKVIPRFITNILEGKPIPIYGSGENVREWIHVDDHCMGIRLVLEGGRSGSIYNIGSDERWSNLNLAHALLDELNHDNSLISFVADRPGHDIRYALDSRKIREELGFNTTVDFRSGLKSTVEWYRNNANWWKPLTSDGSI